MPTTRRDDERAGPQDGAPTRARRAARALGFVLLAAALALGAVALAITAVRSGVGRGALRETVEREVGDALGAELEIGELAGRLLPDARLRDVEMRVDGEPAIAFDELVLRFDVDTAVRERRIAIRELELRGLRVRLARDADGGWNLARLGADGAEPPPAAPGAETGDATPVAAYLERARLVGARVELVLAPDRAPIAIDVDGELAELAWPLDADAIERLRARLVARIAPLATSAGDAGGAGGAIATGGAVDAGDAATGAAGARGDGDGALRIDVRDGLLTVAGAGLALPAPAAPDTVAARVDVDARAPLSDWWDGARDADAHVALRLARVDPEALLGDARFAGALDARVGLAISRRAGAHAAAVDLALAPGEVAGLRVEGGALRARATDASAWEVEALSLDAPPLRVRGSARGDDRALAALALDVDVDDLAALPEPALAAWLGADREPGSLAGAARLALRAHGALAAPVLALDANARGLRVAGLALGDVRAEASLAEPSGARGARRGAVDVHTSLARAVHADAVIAGDAVDRVQVEALDVDVARVAALAGGAVALRGAATLGLQLAHPLGDPTGALTLTWRDAAIEGVPLDGVFASARVAGGALDFDASLREVGERRVAIAARGEARWPAGGDTARLLRAETTRVEIEGRGLDVAIAAPLLPRTLRAPGGELDVDLAIAGGGTAPDVSGRVVLRDGGIDVPLARRRYAPIEGAFSLADGVVHVERLAIGLPKDRDGEGPERRGLATIEGDVALDGLVPSSLDLRADLDGFRLSSAPILTTDVRGRLAVHGPLDALAIEGDVRLEDASVRLPDEDDRALREIQVIAASSQDTAASEFAETRARDGAYARSRVDVRIRVPRNTWVRGRGAEVDLQGDVRLAKRPHDALRAVGEARVVRGSLDFQRKRFDLRRGVVTFDGGDDPGDPVIDFEGVHRVRDVNVVIEIAGRLSDPPQLVQLGGEPPMSRDEALAYLVFGRPIDELAQAERGQVQSAALSVAASLAAGEFGRLIADAGIVDTLDIEIGEDGSAQALRVGKYVGDRTFVRYGQTFGDQSEQELQIEYRFTRHLSVESQMSTTGEAGADLILRAEY